MLPWWAMLPSDVLPDVQEPQQKILDIETAVQMLHVVLPEGNEHLEPFSRFLKDQTEYKYMNLDQWTSFYRFSEEVAYPDPWSMPLVKDLRVACSLTELQAVALTCLCITDMLVHPLACVGGAVLQCCACIIKGPRMLAGLQHREALVSCRWVWTAVIMMKGMLGRCYWTTM